MSISEWKPPTDEEAIREADKSYLRQERRGAWSAWRGDGTPPWWDAGFQWVKTVVTATAHRVLAEGHHFDDSIRGLLYGETRKRAVDIYNRKIWHRDAPIESLDKRREFVEWVAREISPTLASIDEEVIICLQDESNSVSASMKEDRAGRRRSFVKPVLNKKGWSIQDWANAAGVDYKSASNYLHGTTNPYPDTRKKLAHALDVEPSTLPD